MHRSIECLPASSPSPSLSNDRRLSSLDLYIIRIRSCVKGHNERLSAVPMVQIEINDNCAINVVLEVA